MGTGTLVAIGTVLGTLVLCGIIVYFVLKNMKKQAYSGVVIGKDEEEREGANDSSYTRYYLSVKTETGEVLKVAVGKKVWEQFVVNDKIIKEAGKYSPTKA